MPVWLSECSWSILHYSYSQSDVAFGCVWLMGRASLFSVPVPQGHCPLRENSVYHCSWQPRSQPDAGGLGGPRCRQRWLIPPQWLIEELQGEAIYNQTFQVQCSSIFSRRRGTETGMARKTSPIQMNLHPNIAPRATQPPPGFSQPFSPSLLLGWLGALEPAKDSADNSSAPQRAGRQLQISSAWMKHNLLLLKLLGKLVLILSDPWP